MESVDERYQMNSKKTTNSVRANFKDSNKSPKCSRCLSVENLTEINQSLKLCKKCLDQLKIKFNNLDIDSKFIYLKKIIK